MEQKFRPVDLLKFLSIPSIPQGDKLIFIFGGDKLPIQTKLHVNGALHQVILNPKRSIIGNQFLVDDQLIAKDFNSWSLASLLLIGCPYDKATAEQRKFVRDWLIDVRLIPDTRKKKPPLHPDAKKKPEGASPWFKIPKPALDQFKWKNKVKLAALFAYNVLCRIGNDRQSTHFYVSIRKISMEYGIHRSALLSSLIFLQDHGLISYSCRQGKKINITLLSIS